MVFARKAPVSVMSIAQSNGIAGPRGPPNLAPPSKARDTRDATPAPSAWKNSSRTNFLKTALSNTSAARAPAAAPSAAAVHHDVGEDGLILELFVGDAVDRDRAGGDLAAFGVEEAVEHAAGRQQSVHWQTAEDVQPAKRTQRDIPCSRVPSSPDCQDHLLPKSVLHLDLV